MKKKKSSNSLISITKTKHYSFIRHITKSETSFGEGKKFKLNKYKRPLKNEIESDGYVRVICADDRYITPTLKLHPESVAFLFHLNGCAKNLMLYIVMLELNHKTGEYKFNIHIRNKFKDYAEQFFGEKYKLTTIDQVHRDLVESNVTCNMEFGLYFLNPLFAGGMNDAGRRMLASKYTELLNKKSKDSLNDIYPIYLKKKN